jgi:hypothetical protein
MNADFDLKHWENVKYKLLKLYPQLTDADLIWRHETKNNLYNLIASKLVISKKELSEIVESL